MCGPVLCTVPQRPRIAAVHPTSARRSNNLPRFCARADALQKNIIVPEAAPVSSSSMETTTSTLTGQTSAAPPSKSSTQPTEERAQPTRTTQDGTSLYSMDDDSDNITIEDVLTA